MKAVGIEIKILKNYWLWQNNFFTNKKIKKFAFRYEFQQDISKTAMYTAEIKVIKSSDLANRTDILEKTAAHTGAFGVMMKSGLWKKMGL